MAPPLCRLCLAKVPRTDHPHCLTCDEGFRSGPQLLEHISEYSHQAYDHVCSTCQLGFVKKSQLTAHERKWEHGPLKSEKTFEGDIEFHYGEDQGWDGYLKKILGEKEEECKSEELLPTGHSKYTCSRCSRYFDSYAQLKSHARSAYRQERGWGAPADLPVYQPPFGKPPQQNSFEHLPQNYAAEENLANNTCIRCARTFNSRNQLFVHVRKSNHYAQKAENTHVEVTNVDVESNSEHVNEDAVEEEEEEEEEMMEETFDVGEAMVGNNEYVPDDMQLWEPFPGIVDSNDRIDVFDGDSSWEQKLESTYNLTLAPFLDPNANFGTWPIDELRAIFAEAEALPSLPNDDTRYFRNEQFPEIEPGCDHADACGCYFEISPNAGITGLGAQSKAMRKDRKACIQHMHSLCVQLLIILTMNELHNLDTDEKWLLRQAIIWMDPKREELDGDVVEDERNMYLTLDSKFQRFAIGKFDEEGTGERTINDPDFLRLCGTLGRRALALTVCRIGDGYHFIKKQPLHYWDVSKLVADVKTLNIANSYGMPWERKLQMKKIASDAINAKTHVIVNPRYNVEQPRYPIRVINTHTFDFEEDTALFQKSYAILSHTWSTRGKEVSYQDARRVFHEAKRESLRNKITKLTAKLEENPKADDISEINSEIQAAIQDLEALEKWPFSTQTVTNEAKKQHNNSQVDPATVGTAYAKEIGKTKLIKAICAARDLGFTYLWVDSCCINTPNNTELVESISSMGDWYQNSKLCIVYIEDFTGTTVTSKRAAKNRYATRGWTLQEIVMSPHAMFYNRNWTIIADSNEEQSRKHLANICRIPQNLLCCGGVPKVGASLVLQLANRRRTFKPEDRAYSLMGILGVRMAVDYGEGQAKAMTRLFETIIRTTSDVSIFNWTGRYAACMEPGRSMYPLDFDGYEAVADLDRDPELDLNFTDDPAASKNSYDYRNPDEVKPALAVGQIALDHIGVHARFEICSVECVIEGDNDIAYVVTQALGEQLAESTKPSRQSCSFQVSFTFPSSRQSIQAELLCPIKIVNDYLRHISNPASSGVEIKWVFARFAGVQNSNWFLCEIRTYDKFGPDGLFENVLASFGSNNHDFGEFMHYLEGSGFVAKRIPTSWVDQKMIVFKQADIKSAYLWVG